MTNLILQTLWQKLIDVTISGRHSEYSIYDYVDDGDDILSEHDLDKPNNILHKGEYVLRCSDWETGYMIVSDVTIKKIANIFHNHNDGHHIYLEKIEVNEKDKTILLKTGS